MILQNPENFTKMKTRSNQTQKTVVLSLIIFIVFFGSILFQI
jgi:hypothetical protein